MSSTRHPASIFEFKVTVEPPKTNTHGHEQYFYIRSSASDLQEQEDGRLAIGSHISGYIIKLRRRDKTPATFAAQTEVPIILYDEEAALVVTAFDKLDPKEKKWEIRFSYDLSELKPLAHGKMASTWEIKEDEKKASESSSSSASAAAAASPQTQQLKLKVPKIQIYQEKVKLTGPEYQLQLTSPDTTLLLTLQKAVNEKTGEPLSFFVDRWWALTKIAVIGPISRFGH